MNHSSGVQNTKSEMNDLFIDVLSEMFDDHRDLFAVDIRSSGDISEKYHVYRSFRRGLESRAVAKEVSVGDRYHQVNK